MHDREFAGALEACTLPSTAFDHRGHVRLAWIYLGGQPLLQALPRFVTTLKRYAASLGGGAKYHETITFAFLLLIEDRMKRSPAPSFDAFADDNPDLLRSSVLERYYEPATLSSELARTRFVLPDRLDW